MTPKKKINKINYWLGYDGLCGFNRIDHITEEEWKRPRDVIYFAIHKKMGVSFYEEGVTNESHSIRLVFDFKDRLETGLLYRFKGYE